MRIFLLIFLLIFSSSVMAALSENFNLTEAQYSAKVKPYLQSLDNDFYELFLSFRPELTAIKDVSKNNIKIKRELKYMDKTCNKQVFMKCQASLNNLLKLAEENHSFIQSLKNIQYCSKDALKKCIFAMEILNDLYLVSFRTKNNLTLATLSSAPKISWVQIEKDLSELNTLSQSFIAQSFPDANNQDFQLIWGTFFKEVEDLFLPSSDAKLFQAWVDRLNFAMNEFLLSLSNKEKILPSGLKNKAESMHGKWNIMLREHL